MSFSDEEEPLTPMVVIEEEIEETNIDFNEDDYNENIDIDDHKMSHTEIDNNNIDINKREDDETQNLIDNTNDDDNNNLELPENTENALQSDDVMIESNNNDNNDELNGSNEENEENIENELKNDVIVPVNTEMVSPNSTISTVSHNQSIFSVDSVGSEPMVSNANKTTKARIICTWVPKQNTGSELTVIAGDIVTIIHSEPITLIDNPLALMNDAISIDKIIILKSMHWTQIQCRNKIGVIPSNIVLYDNNPINKVWIKVKIEHSYMAKSVNELTISSGERLQIFGCVKVDGMIMAKRKDGTQGLIPYNFVEIPSAIQLTTINAPSSYLRNSSVSSGVSNSNDDGIRGSVSASHHSSKSQQQQQQQHHHYQGSSRQLNFVIDDTMTPIDDVVTTPISAHSLNVNDNNIILNKSSKKYKLTSKIKAISTSISTAIDKIQTTAYSHGASKTLEPIPVSSNLTTPSAKKQINIDNDIGINNTINGLNGLNVSNGLNVRPSSAKKYEWNAPLQWKKVYIIKDFNATQDEIDMVYKLFILDKQSRGRNESILHYEEATETKTMGHDDYFDKDQFNVAAPSKSKKTIGDVIRITINDSIEISEASQSPEGWVLARFCADKEHKGFVPISYLQFLDDINTNTNTSGIGILLQQHQENQDSGSVKMQQETHQTQQNIVTRSSESSTFPVTNTKENDIDIIHHDHEIEEQIETPSTINDIIPSNESRMNNINIIIPRSKQPLPFHWPFSSYPIKKRTKKSKLIESMILLFLLIIYLLPIIVEDPSPKNAPKKYNIWFVNFIVVFLPWLIIFILRMLELWTKFLSKNENPNNRLYATLLFYIILIVYFFGLFAIVIEVLIQYQWIRDNSPLLFVATMVEMIVFMSCVTIIILLIIFILIWTFCCRITRNRWETRIDFYCCTKGEAVRTKRYPRTQK